MNHHRLLDVIPFESARVQDAEASPLQRRCPASHAGSTNKAYSENRVKHNAHPGVSIGSSPVSKAAWRMTSNGWNPVPTGAGSKRRLHLESVRFIMWMKSRSTADRRERTGFLRSSASCSWCPWFDMVLLQIGPFCRICLWAGVVPKPGRAGETNRPWLCKHRRPCARHSISARTGTGRSSQRKEKCHGFSNERTDRASRRA